MCGEKASAHNHAAKYRAKIEDVDTFGYAGLFGYVVIAQERLNRAEQRGF